VTKTTNSNVRYEVITQEGDDGDLIIPLPMPLLKSLGWKEGDDVTISIDEKGNLFLKKAER
jgi:bifunctional DNA-binding transcriptional regulator/antitoxin component of YhaV-PrlF toxin-antitoxin module